MLALGHKLADSLSYQDHTTLPKKTVLVYLTEQNGEVGKAETSKVNPQNMHVLQESSSKHSRGASTRFYFSLFFLF